MAVDNKGELNLKKKDISENKICTKHTKTNINHNNSNINGKQ